MERLTFDYYLMMKRTEPDGPPVNVLAVADSLGPTQAVCRGYRHKTWEFRPEVAATWLDPDRDDLILIPADRATAERATAGFTPVPLPSEEELTRICRVAGPNGRPGMSR
ncbi:hypothetical protein CIK06_27630 [Plantactinospora sp. KBS50]|nr:hypothetical protein CIK06_27630 [Plantactinospora sp. KBS50]